MKGAYYEKNYIRDIRSLISNGVIFYNYSSRGEKYENNRWP